MQTVSINNHPIPVEICNDVPPRTIYLINDNFTLQHPVRKNGKPDMRFGINKLEKIFEDAIKVKN